MTSEAQFTYQTLAEMLRYHDPAECHGLLCGLLCTDETLARDTWLQHIGLDHIGLDHTQSHSIELLHGLFKITHQQLQHDDFIFQLLLPDDEQELTFRVDALGNWCQGFLAGLGLGGMQSTAQLSYEVKDFLEDVSHIARVGLAADESDEEDEIAYVEITEYLRAGVLLVGQELQHDKKFNMPAPIKLH